MKKNSQTRPIEMSALQPREGSARLHEAGAGAAASAAHVVPLARAGANQSGDPAWTAEDLTSFHPMELLTLAEVEERTCMRRSNIYRLIGLGLFPAPVHGLGGSKWITAEVGEFIARKRDERDRLRGANNFAPRPAILAGLGAAVHASENADSPAPPPSTVRILDREMVDALRMLHVEIPELYLDPSAFNVSLAVIKVELQLQPPVKQDSKRRNKR